MFALWRGRCCTILSAQRARHHAAVHRLQAITDARSSRCSAASVCGEARSWCLPGAAVTHGLPFDVAAMTVQRTQ